ncbi:MAG TPA: aminotransferase class I/II-fold pyridoxal phosphate-dependent enzyme, partial [Candidatus Binataceae bacterium]
SSIESLILRGSIPPGTHLPAIRSQARKLGVSPATVAAAYRALHQRGMVSAQRRRGTIVNPAPPIITRPATSVPSGARNLAAGNPDSAFMPPIASLLRGLNPAPRRYGERANRADLLRLAAGRFEADGIPAAPIAVVGGAMDGIERVLGAHLRAGDMVAVEDPGYSSVFDLVRALGLGIVPVAVDNDFGLLPHELARTLGGGRVSALIVTPRAQNPTGAALNSNRASELRKIIRRHPEVLLIEDDHAGSVAGVPAITLCDGSSARWAVIRSVSKSLGPDLRVALVTGDELTIGRVEGRQSLGTGWVSHILQALVVAMWSDAAVERMAARAAEAYSARRRILIAALGRHGIAAYGRSGLNVWIPVAEEVPVVQSLLDSGWAIAAGERYRIRSAPAVRITVTELASSEIDRLAADIAKALAPHQISRSA